MEVASPLTSLLLVDTLALVRVPIIIITFVVLWGIDVHIFHLFKLDINTILNIRIEDTDKATPWHFTKWSLVIFSELFFTVLVFNYILQVSLPTTILWFYIFSLLTFFSSSNTILYKNIQQFFSIIRYVFSPTTDHSVPFVEIFVADALTSLSRVFSDFGMSIYLIVNQIFPHDEQLSFRQWFNVQFFSATLASLPFLIRINQCRISYQNSIDKRQKKLHLINVGKYFCSLPLIWLPVLYKVLLASNISNGQIPDRHNILLLSPKEVPNISQQPTQFYLMSIEKQQMMVTFVVYFMVFTAIINSVYSFIWDIQMDWGLFIFQKNDNFLKCLPCTMRNKLIKSGILYFAVVFVNGLLRCTWTLNHMNLHGIVDRVLILELLEIFRRSFWNILRIEWESLQQEEHQKQIKNLNSNNFLKEFESIQNKDDPNEEISMTLLSDENFLTNSDIGINNDLSPLLMTSLIRNGSNGSISSANTPLTTTELNPILNLNQYIWTNDSKSSPEILYHNPYKRKI